MIIASDPPVQPILGGATPMDVDAEIRDSVTVQQGDDAEDDPTGANPLGTISRCSSAK